MRNENALIQFRLDKALVSASDRTTETAVLSNFDCHPHLKRHLNHKLEKSICKRRKGRLHTLVKREKEGGKGEGP